METLIYKLPYRIKGGKDKEVVLSISFIPRGVLKVYNETQEQVHKLVALWEEHLNLITEISAAEARGEDPTPWIKKRDEVDLEVQAFAQLDMFEQRVNAITRMLGMNPGADNKIEGTEFTICDFDFWDNHVHPKDLFTFIDTCIAHTMPKETTVKKN